MPGLTGVEAAKEIAQLDLGDDALLPEMVFITAYDQYALDAFEQGAVDYVLKPAEPERLRVTAERLQKRLMQRAGEGSDSEATASSVAEFWWRRLCSAIAACVVGATQRPTRTVLVLVTGLGWAKHSNGGRGGCAVLCQRRQVHARANFETRVFDSQTHQRVGGRTRPRHFWQIHRSTLVSVKAIEGVVRDDRGRQMVMVRGSSEKLQVSRNAARLFRSM